MSMKLFGAVRLWILNFACDCEMRSIAWTDSFTPDSDREGWLAVLSRMKHLAARYLALTVWIILVPISLVSFSPTSKRLRGQMRVIWRNSLALEIKEKCQIAPVFVVAEAWTDAQDKEIWEMFHATPVVWSINERETRAQEKKTHGLMPKESTW